MLSNIYTPIDLVSGAKYKSASIILDDNSIFNKQLVDNQVNNSSNLLLTRCNYDFVQSSSKSYFTTMIYFF